MADTNSDLLQIAIPAVVGVISSITTFFVAKTNSKKDLTINDRQQLSEDEKQFRAELRDTINSYKEELEQARNDIRQLRGEVEKLHKINLDLTLENKQLQLKVDSLRTELMLFKSEEKEHGEVTG